jgi:hypothetical protein
MYVFRTLDVSYFRLDKHRVKIERMTKLKEEADELQAMIVSNALLNYVLQLTIIFL